MDSMLRKRVTSDEHIVKTQNKKACREKTHLFSLQAEPAFLIQTIESVEDSG